MQPVQERRLAARPQWDQANFRLPDHPPKILPLVVTNYPTHEDRYAAKGPRLHVNIGPSRWIVSLERLMQNMTRTAAPHTQFISFSGKFMLPLVKWLGDLRNQAELRRKPVIDPSLRSISPEIHEYAQRRYKQLAQVVVQISN